MVRVGPQSFIARPAWYDRNPSSYVYTYEAEVGPHGVTTRITYAVPAGKKAMVEILHCSLEITSAATTAALRQAHFEFYSAAQAAWTKIPKVELTNTFNTPGNKEKAEIGTTLTLLAGESIRGRTQDGSSGGLVRWYMTMKITEFDA